MKNQIKVFIGEKNIVKDEILAFINAGHVCPISLGGEMLPDGRLFTTISFINVTDEESYEIQEVIVGSIADGEELLAKEIEASIPESNVICHEMIVDNASAKGALSIIYLLQV